jgi:hypothetical protein
MSTSNGEGNQPRGPLELSETLTIETNEGTVLAFEVVGILQDAQGGTSYAVLHHEDEDEEEDEFIVTDLEGNLLEDDTLAQQILDDFLDFTDDDEGRVARNGETG